MAFSIAISTTAPTGSATTTIFDSTVAFGPKQLRHLPLRRLAFATMNDQAGTIQLSKSIDGGTTWDILSSTAVAIPAANNISGPYDYLVDTYDDVRLQWVNGGTNQTVWRPELHAIEDTRQPGT